MEILRIVAVLVMSALLVGLAEWLHALAGPVWGPTVAFNVPLAIGIYLVVSLPEIFEALRI